MYSKIDISSLPVKVACFLKQDGLQWQQVPTDRFFFFQVQTRGAAWQLVPALNGNNGKEKTPVQKPYEEDHQNWKLGIYYPASQPVGC